MERIPILRMGPNLLVSIEVDMYDQLAQTLLDDLGDRIVREAARGVLIDISALDVVDSYIGGMFNRIAQLARILDAETVIVGIRPAVAITLVELGISLRGIKTALDVEQGMKILREAEVGATGGGLVVHQED